MRAPQYCNACARGTKAASAEKRKFSSTHSAAAARERIRTEDTKAVAPRERPRLKMRKKGCMMESGRFLLGAHGLSFLSLNGSGINTPAESEQEKYLYELRGVSF
jgi:hypothetical protein